MGRPKPSLTFELIRQRYNLLETLAARRKKLRKGRNGLSVNLKKRSEKQLEAAKLRSDASRERDESKREQLLARVEECEREGAIAEAFIAEFDAKSLLIDLNEKSVREATTPEEFSQLTRLVLMANSGDDDE